MAHPNHRTNTLIMICLLASMLMLAGCSSSGDEAPTRTQNTTQARENGAQNSDAQNNNFQNNNAKNDNPKKHKPGSEPRVPVKENRDGIVYDQKIHVEKTGDTIAITVMEPTQMRVGQTYPLVLHSHGYGGHRNHEPSKFQQRLRDAGYYVISIDERGFGESSGTVRVMSPDFAGQDLVAVLNWAETLPGLRRRPNGKMDVGSYGGSYGGMYQYILAGTDPKERLTVIAPDIAPYDLTYSLDPHGVVKTGWGLVLAGAGEVPILGLLTGGKPISTLVKEIHARSERLQYSDTIREDPVVYETLIRAALTGHFPKAGLHMFRYHSLRYFCEDVPAKPQNGFIIGTPDPRNVPPGGLPEIDALITQGFRDTLFNFNDGYHAYQCLKSHGGDVRLLTHQSGHILPLSLSAIPGWDKYADALYGVIRIPEFQEPAGSRTCGSIDLQNATFAWFQAKLKGKNKLLKKVLPPQGKVCLSLSEGHAITVDNVTIGGKPFPIDMDTPVLSGPLLGVVTSLLGTRIRDATLQTQKFYTAPPGGAVIAGIPTIDIHIKSILDQLPSPATCKEEPLDNLLGRLTGQLSDFGLLHQLTQTIDQALPINCDPVYFLALAERSPGEQQWDIIDGQITPIRGYGEHKIQMNGIAIRLHQKDQVALVILGFNLQYPLSFSRDLAIIAAKVNGTIKLPILSPKEIVKDHV